MCGGEESSGPEQLSSPPRFLFCREWKERVSGAGWWLEVRGLCCLSQPFPSGWKLKGCSVKGKEGGRRFENQLEKRQAT